MTNPNRSKAMLHFVFLPRNWRSTLKPIAADHWHETIYVSDVELWISISSWFYALPSATTIDLKMTDGEGLFFLFSVLRFFSAMTRKSRKRKENKTIVGWMDDCCYCYWIGMNEWEISWIPMANLAKPIAMKSFHAERRREWKPSEFFSIETKMNMKEIDRCKSTHPQQRCH